MMPPLIAATLTDAEAIAELRNRVADDMTRRHGRGAWSGRCTDKGVLFDLRHAVVCLARIRGRAVASLKLAIRKPWAIDRSFFTPVDRPLYLTAMVVTPDLQRQGLGRHCLEEAARLARRLPADAIFLDAFDHPTAGAGEFYRKCGFRETGRSSFRQVPLRYFELLLGGDSP